jgi:MerR family transcriptional regulator, activator of bmr gene
LGKKLFSIGETSRIKGITRKALRFYDKIGLLKPSFMNPANGYRYYSMEQFVHIDIIKALRAIDVSPLAIRTMLLKKNTAELMTFLDSQRRSTDRKIAELRRITETIDGVQDTIRCSLASFSHKGVYRRRIGQRHVVTLPFKGAFTEEDVTIAFSRLDRIMDERGLVNGYQTGIRFESGTNGSVSSFIFNTVRAVEGSDASTVSILPEGEYVCVCYSRENAVERQQKINRYCARNGLKPTLILQVELLNDVFAIDSPTVELQLLVSAALSRPLP